MKACAICNKPVESNAKTGRPKDYCSVVCRRMAEREILRIEKRIGELEHDLMSCRRLPANTMLGEGRAGEVIIRIEAELKRQNDRFRLLLTASGDTVSFDKTPSPS